MKDTKLVGDVSTAMILSSLLRMKRNVLLPFGDRHRYDLVIETDGTFLRVQCKTGRLEDGCIVFNCYSVVKDSKTKKYVHKTYEDQVDAYGVYCPQVDKSYLIPAEKCSRSESRLLFDENNISDRRMKMERASAHVLGG
jgi:hypothetical protein